MNQPTSATEAEEQNSINYVEVEGRIVGNSQIERQAGQSPIVSANGRVETEIAEYITIVPQNNPQRSFVLDISNFPGAEKFLPRQNVKIRISAD